MKIYKNKNGITLIALVITIVITLLISAIAIQLTLGENGLISKANQAKIEQEKSELYDDAKLEYLNLKTKAIENILDCNNIVTIIKFTFILSL